MRVCVRIIIILMAGSELKRGMAPPISWSDSTSAIYSLEDTSSLEVRGLLIF